MKCNFIIPSLLLTISFFFFACETELSVGQETEAKTEISSNNLSGFLDSETFIPSTTHFERSELFGDEGYDIKLFREQEDCDEFQSIGDISFFVATDTDLTVGTYEAKGPYFRYGDGDDYGTSSFFGADVIIEEVTATSITGRVRGGDDKDIHYIEGKFVAELCQK